MGHRGQQPRRKCSSHLHTSQLSLLCCDVAGFFLYTEAVWTSANEEAQDSPAEY